MSFHEKIKNTLDIDGLYDEPNIKDILFQIRPTFQEVQSSIPSPEGLEYGRNVIYQNNKFEVILIYLPAFSKTSVHDHGNSSGWIYVVDGQLLNLIYNKSNNGVEYKKNESYQRGDIFSVTGDTTHAMYNPGFSSTVTLHIYSPPLGTGQVFKPHD
ncbi:cysteine dioxygenase [Fictibacillus phosphorivorans]|uniref:cysteine dioxygenase n=1 Tax=Fictibacillus phosphorivorans TaxID=1221500 RepID=UPI0020418A97|nr:cysteine dioxygenase family protein [Fictibacillus phosphorivorans]MCM3717063.1 cysteine dioxygenase family protein [Fictibacillus phosphorivorans]MCM3774750.1 cysteine dioxygenase family protein [Fictibacillus phosphorivorans]